MTRAVAPWSTGMTLGVRACQRARRLGGVAAAIALHFDSSRGTKSILHARALRWQRRRRTPHAATRRPAAEAMASAAAARGAQVCVGRWGGRPTGSRPRGQLDKAEWGVFHVAARAVRSTKAHSYLPEIRIKLARTKKHLLEIQNTLRVSDRTRLQEIAQVKVFFWVK